MKKWVVISVVVIGFALAMAVEAGPGRAEGPRGSASLAERAGLSEEDEQALEDLSYEYRKEIIPLRANSQLAQLEVRRLLGQEKTDEAAVMKAVEAAGQAEIALEKARIAHQLRIRGVLGPEKSAQLREMRRECRVERRQGRRDRGAGRGKKAGRRERGGRVGERGPWGHFPGGPGVEEPEPDEPPEE